MPSRREQIQMTDDELLAFLGEELIVTCATIGPRGFPHLMPLWFVVRDGTVWAWTFGKSQKVKNLERDPRATLQFEAGEGDYAQLRGAMIEAETVIHHDVDTILPIGLELMSRYAGGAGIGPDAEAMVRGQAVKRVALEFRETRRATWDHRKLGGAY